MANTKAALSIVFGKGNNFKLKSAELTRFLETVQVCLANTIDSFWGLLCFTWIQENNSAHRY